MMSLSEMPKDGQFVAVWKNGGVVFSQTFLYSDGDLLAYDFTCDDWDQEHGYDEKFLTSREDVIFFQVESV